MTAPRGLDFYSNYSQQSLYHTSLCKMQAKTSDDHQAPSSEPKEDLHLMTVSFGALSYTLRREAAQGLALKRSLMFTLSQLGLARRGLGFEVL